MKNHYVLAIFPTVQPSRSCEPFLNLTVPRAEKRLAS